MFRIQVIQSARSNPSFLKHCDHAFAYHQETASEPHFHAHFPLFHFHFCAGITCSKTDEGLVFLRAGVRSVMFAYPILDGRKLQRIMVEARQRKAEVGEKILGNSNEKEGEDENSCNSESFACSIHDGRKLQRIVVEAEQRKAEEAHLY